MFNTRSSKEDEYKTWKENIKGTDFFLMCSFQQLHSCSTEGRGFLADTDCCVFAPLPFFRLVFVLMDELKSIAVVIVPTTPPKCRALQC